MTFNKTYKLTALALSVLSVSALAEDAYLLDSSVVSASGFAQDIKEAPASISIITNKDLESRPVRDVGDAVDFVPGVEVSKSKTGSSQIQIRGFDSKYTAILIDGKRQNSSDALIQNGFDPNASFLPPMSMIDRIEVIRGPASTIYGSDAIGGVVNIITKKNPDKLTGSFGIDTLLQEHHGTYGNAFSYNGYVALPLIDDKLSLSLRGKSYDKEASALYKPDHSYATHSSGEYDLYNYGGRLNYGINDKHNIYADFEHNFEQGSVNSTSSRSIMSRKDFERDNFVLNYDGDTDFGKINSYLQYNKTELVGQASSGPNGVGGLQDKPHDTYYSKNYIAKTSIVTPFNLGDYGFVNLNSGYELWHERFRNDGAESIAGRDLIQNQHSLFLESEYFITNDLILTTGARYTYGSIFGSHLTPRVYLNYALTDGISAKAGVSAGYKVPNLPSTINGLAKGTIGDSEVTYGNPDLKPETSVNYEIGMIFENANVGSLTLTTFYTTFKDKIVTEEADASMGLANADKCSFAGGGTDCYIYQNVDESVAYGVEALFNTKAFYGFYLDGSYTYTTAKETSGINDGQPLSQTPRHNVMLRLNYEYNDFHAYLKAVGKYRTPVTNTKTNPYTSFFEDYEVFDLGFNYTLAQKHHFSFVISNLFDKDFNTYIEGERNGRVSYGSMYNDYIEGRNYYLSYSMQF